MGRTMAKNPMKGHGEARPPMQGISQPPVTADCIRKRAYEIYLERQRKGAHGDALSDWAAAEKQLGLKK